MPYTNTWSTSIPAGSLAANQIDSAIQQTRLDIAQRINTILGADGSMSNDPVLNGTTVKDLTVLTAELATKTTLSGLTNGVIPKATGAGSIGNSSISEAALVALFAVFATRASDSTSTTNAIKFNPAPGSAGWYLVTFSGSPNSPPTYAEIKTATDTVKQWLVSSTDFTHTALVYVNSAVDTIICQINTNIGGTYNLRYQKIS